MDYFYLSTILVTLLLMIALTIHVLGHSGFNKTQKAWFITTFGSVSFCALAEFAVHYNGGTYIANFEIPLTILTVLQFSLSPCLAFMFAGALGLKKQALIGLIVLGIDLTVESICAPFGAIFIFSGGVYSRGPAFLFYTITYILSLGYMIVALFIVGKRFNHRDVGTIAMVLAVLVGGIVPMTVANVHIAYVAVGIGACICFVYYNDLVQQDMSTELQENQKQISIMQTHITSGLANLIESRDTETGAHVARTSAYVKTLALDLREAGIYTDILTDHYIEMLVTLAPMHDVGKILVSDTILKKPGPLTPEEFEEMKKHAKYGGDVVKEILQDVTEDEYVLFASDIATYHHERWNGKGYPMGLKGDGIPLCARIMAIADVFDALVSKRCYKEPVPASEAFDIIAEESGSHFDPNLVSVFLKNKEKYVDIGSRIKSEL